MDNDDEEFLYGDDDDEPTKVNFNLPTTSNGIQVDENEEEEEGSEEESDSEDDLEIILDGDTSVAPPQQHRRAPLPVREVPLPTPPAPLPSVIVSAEVPEELSSINSTIQDNVEVVAPEALTAPVPPGLVPHGSLTPYQAPLPPSETNPTLDVNFIAKDADGNDLFDLDIDSLGDKPWRRPGANMADYFNYGMNEPAWKNYAAKQKRTRQELMTANNPFAVFADSSITEAWQSLAPEYKAIMMATVMGYQPGMAPPPQMMGMMGMTNNNGMNGGGMNPMNSMNGASGYGQGGFNGMGNMNNMMYPSGGMNNNSNTFAGPRGNFQQGYNGAEGMIPNGAEFAGNNSVMTGEEGFDSIVDGVGLEGVLLAEVDQSATDFNSSSTQMTASASNTAFVGAHGAAIASRGTARGGILGNHIPTAPRGLSVLPANVPTGPRNHGIPTAPRRPAYQDKDRLATGTEGLDYGAGGSSTQREHSPTVSRTSRHEKEISPARSRGGRSRSETVEKEKSSSSSSRRDRDKDSRHYDEPKDEEMYRTGSTSSSSRRKRGVDEFFPDKNVKEESTTTTGIKIRSGVKSEQPTEEVLMEEEFKEGSHHSSRRNEESSESRRRRIEKSRAQEDENDAAEFRKKQNARHHDTEEDKVDSRESSSRRRGDRVDIGEEEASSRRSKRSSREDEKDSSRRSARSGEDEVKSSARRSSRTEEEQDTSSRRNASSYRSNKGTTTEEDDYKSRIRRHEYDDKESEAEREVSRLKRRKVEGTDGDFIEDEEGDGSRRSRSGR